MSEPTKNYEWQDSTGLKHPSLVILDVTNNNLPNPDEFNNLPVLKTKKIYFVNEYFNRGLLNRRKLPKIAGFEFCWYDATLRNSQHALYMGYRLKK